MFSRRKLLALSHGIFRRHIESMREFDPATQRSKQSVDDHHDSSPLGSGAAAAFFDKLVEVLAARTPQGREARLAPGWSASYAGPFPGWEFYLPLAEPHPNTLFSLFEKPVHGLG